MSVETAAFWGGKSRFGFVANSGDRNEVGIAEKICIGYKGNYVSESETMTALGAKCQEGG